MYYNDHAPPHFHAIYGEHEATYKISSLELFTGSLPRRAHNLVLEWADVHRAELASDWDRARRGETLINIKPLE
jgi:hypothetical protein